MREERSKHRVCSYHKSFAVANVSNSLGVPRQHEFARTSRRARCHRLFAYCIPAKYREHLGIPGSRTGTETDTGRKAKRKAGGGGANSKKRFEVVEEVDNRHFDITDHHSALVAMLNNYCHPSTHVFSKLRPKTTR